MRSLNHWSNLTPVLLGLVAFVLLVGIEPLYPKNINWLRTWDALENYVGWVFYRYDAWRFPVGLNPNNGLEIASSIVYSDSIPLMAILLKPFSDYLGEPFQYFGIWYLICFLLQSFFAWLLVGLLTKDFWCRFFATGLFVFAPPFMWKLGMTEAVGTHPAPASHFVIIAAIYLIARKEQSYRILLWALLLVSSCLINFYLFVMVCMLWIGNLLDHLMIEKKYLFGSSCKEVCIVFLAVLIAGWQAGYFVKNGVPLGDIGYGFFRMPVLSLFDPRGWSYLIPSFPQATQIESKFNLPLDVGIVHGFQYMGLGVLSLFLVAALRVVINRSLINQLMKILKEHVFVIGGLILLSIFSISNNISIASFNLHIPVSDAITNMAGTLRSSGRMFWPVFYCILFTILFIILRTNKILYLRFILAICFVLQVIDTSAGWLPIQQRLQRDSTQTYQTRFSHPFWEDAPKIYKQIATYPLQNSIFQPNWEHIAPFTSTHKMSTNAVYLARIDPRKVGDANQKFINDLRLGKLDEKTIYILDDSMLIPALMYMKSDKDLFARISNFLILIPNGKLCKSCVEIPKDLEIDSFSTMSLNSSMVIFERSNKLIMPILAGGHNWGWDGDLLTIPKGAKARLVMPIPKGNIKNVELMVDSKFTPEDSHNRLSVTLDGYASKDFLLNRRSKNYITLPIDEKSLINGFVNIEISDPVGATKPSNLENILYLMSAKFHE